MQEGNDRGYRLIFSHPEMVERLLRQFVAEPWIEHLDFSTLEKMSERDLGPDLERREKDLLWRLRCRTESGERPWLYLFIHLEFQSKVEPLMALRGVQYKALLWEDLARQKALLPSRKVPPVFALVLYNGMAKWSAPLSLESLVEPIPGKTARESILEYTLIDVRRLNLEELGILEGPVAQLFDLEQSEDLDSVRKGVARLEEGLRDEDQNGLREAFAVWLSNVLIPARTTKPAAEIREISDLTEVKTMLAQRVLEWTEQWKAEGLERGLEEGLEKGLERGLRKGLKKGLEKGLEKGLREGRQEGLLKGQRRLLQRQLETKFGGLDAPWKTQLHQATSRQLETWSDRILTANTVDEVFG